MKFAAVDKPRLWEGALGGLVLVVGVHSLLLGLTLLLFPRWALDFVAWPYDGQVFWPRQAGLFLVLLGMCYASALRVRPAVWLLIGSKASAIVFLLASVAIGDAPRAALALGAVDGAMGLAVALVFWQLRRAELAR